MEKTTSMPALVFRSAAVFVILFQFRLIAADLADTSVFTAALLAGFAVPIFLSILRANKKPVSPAAAIVSIALIPWVARAFIAMPRLFIPHSTGPAAIALDSMLLHLDRNNFVSLIPFYWSAVSTFFSIRSRTFLRAAVVLDVSLLLFLFSITQTSGIEIYRWPVVMIIVFAAVVFLQALALLFSMPPAIKMRVKEICYAIAALLIIVFVGSFLFLKPFQERAVQIGGGLLEPNLFSLDITNSLRLNSEISMSNDLVFIVRKENSDNILLRRSVLSGYNRRQGFFQIEGLDDRAHPHRLPAHRVNLSPPEFERTRSLLQKYFLVNIDGSAFIGMNEPVTIIPYDSWDASSFRTVYAVESLVSIANFWDLVRSVPPDEHPTAQQLGLSESEFAIYTYYGDDERIRMLAQRITAGHNRYAHKVIAVYNYLKYGYFRYSLRPGIAPDGDQLGRFLFHTRRGYCSYFAFAMTLLLRSLEIPARIATGFFIDPATNTFNYYPVRADMAHAWVEVLFPGLGWIEFDPTTEYLAEGEDFSFLAGTDPALFEMLMREIFENSSRLTAREGEYQEISAGNFRSFSHNAINMMRNFWLPVLVAALAVIILYLRWGYYFSVFFTKNPRLKSILLMKHAFRRISLARLRRHRSIAESEWALENDTRYKGIYSMYQSAAAARFAPEYTNDDFETQKANYKTFCASFKKNKKTLSLILLLIFAASQTNAQTSAREEFTSADELFRSASDSDFAEHWDRAIELYKEGVRRFHDDKRFSYALGNLYFSRRLFRLAWDEFRRADVIAPDNPAVLIRLARTAALLNKDALSVEYYERVLGFEPDNMDVISNLGWMYFKTHRLEDGERLLTSALERFGDDADLAMTLAIIYAEMYRYDDSRYWYEKAIAMGESFGDRLFTAIAWYNLSILESRFFRYERSMEAANASLAIMDRATGRITRGDLFRRQMDMERAQREFERAYEIDTSPLARVNLAFIYQMSGRLEEARLYAEKSLRSGDNSWMFYFGIDPNRYRRDIHHVLANIYYGLANVERLSAHANLREKAGSLFRRMSYRFRYEVHIRLYRKYCLAVADAFTASMRSENRHDGLHLNSYLQYYNAFRGYPRRAITYLNRARAFETAIIPAAAPSYYLEIGILTGNERLVEKALLKLDELWERDLIFRAYREFARPQNKRFFNVRLRCPKRAAQEMFALNRGGLRQAGIRLPAEVNLIFSEETVRARRHLQRALAKTGFRKTGDDARYNLTVRISGSKSAGYSGFFELTDRFGEVTLRQMLPLQDLSRAGIYAFARMLGNAVFTVN